MKVLLLPDKLNWAYSSIAKSLVKYNTDPSVELDIIHIKGNEKKIKKVQEKYDEILVMGWQTHDRVKFLPPERTLIGIHSHHSWDGQATQPDKNVSPPRTLVDFLNQFKRVNAVSRKLYNLFGKYGVKRIYHTPNGVDSEIFVPKVIPHDDFLVGYSGSSKHDWRKGVTDFIIPATKQAGAKTHLAMLSTGSYVDLEDMPSFYQSIDCYVCASSSEGFSLSVLEAASCGKPVISTRVGGSDELFVDGENGFLVSRDVTAIAEKISLLKNNREVYDKISRNIRQTIEDQYCWKYRVQDWIRFLKGG